MAELAKDEPVRAIKNAIERIRRHLAIGGSFGESADTRIVVANLTDCLEDELEIVDRGIEELESRALAHPFEAAVAADMIEPVKGQLIPIPAGLLKRATTKIRRGG